MKRNSTRQGLPSDETDEFVRTCGAADQDSTHNIADNLAPFSDRHALNRFKSSISRRGIIK